MRRASRAIRGFRGTAAVALAVACVAATAAKAADVTPPGEVSNLLANRSGSDVALTWSPVVDDVTGQTETVASYRVYRGVTPDFVPDRAGGSNRIGSPAGTSFTDLGAADSGTTFFYLTSAVDSAGNESNTEPSAITTAPVLSGTWTETTIDLSWTAAEPSSQVWAYKVYYGTAPHRYDQVQDVGLSTSTSLTGLSPNTAYYIAVRAVDLAGNGSTFSNEHVDAVAGRATVRAHNDDYLCWGAGGCPPRPGAVQRSDGWQLNVPVDLPPGDWRKITVTYTIDSRLCKVGVNGTTDKCGGTNPGGYNPCGDPWDRIANLYLVLDEACLSNGQSCINRNQLELMRAITPFGTDAPAPNGDGTVPPRVLTLDVTPFRSLLVGRRWVGAEIGHYVQAGWHVTVDFKFSKRPEEASPKKPADGVAQLVFEGGGSILTPRQVTIPSSAQQVYGRFFMSGHGGNQACDGGSANGQPCSTGCPGGSCQNCDEFCQREHRIKVDGQNAWVVTPWRTDCSPGSVTACTSWNACGWPSCTFSRAGWCPGYIACHKDAPCDQDIDLTNRLTAGTTHDVTWEIPIINGDWAKSMVVFWYNQTTAVCGNGIREGSEICDGTDLGGDTCQAHGFNTGTLQCNATCDGVDTSQCRNWQCGNHICEPAGGEDCLSCVSDCNGVQGGNPGNRYCCGDGAGQNPVTCADPRCTGGGNTCQ